MAYSQTDLSRILKGDIPPISIPEINTTYQKKTDVVKCFVNGERVSPKMTDLINPDNIEKLDFTKTNDTILIRITTKKIAYLDYSALKKRLKFSANQNPEIVIDTETYDDKCAILIDKSIVKSIKKIRAELNDTILIKTIFYKERTRKPKVWIRGNTTAYNMMYAPCRSFALELNR